MPEVDDFGEVADRFSEHYDEVRGHVREQVTRHNLDAVLRLSSTKEKLRIADVGGGAGRDSAWAASLGHKVVLIEPAKEQIEKAYAREDSNTFDIVQASAGQAFNVYGTTPFDIVLSHMVMPYGDPKEHLGHLAGVTKQLGTVSLLTSGLYGKEARYAAELDFKNLKSLKDSGKYANKLGLEARAHSPKEVTDLLEQNGFNVLRWFGVRIFSNDDYRKISELSQEELDVILSEEIRLSKVEECRGMGQMLHFIARKK